MAHRTNVIPVLRNFESSSDGSSAKVIDPICGKQLGRREARHTLFRGEQSFGFCSQDCLRQFTHPKKKPELNSEAA